MTDQEKHNRICEEEDPFLREIWAAGYDDIETDHRTRELILYNSKTIKKIPLREFIHNYKIIRGVLPDGRIHSWISEADGSCERFRKLIS